MSVTQYVTNLKSVFDAHRTEAETVAMSKYMRDQFPFYGIKKPQREMLTKAFWKQEGLPNVEEAESVFMQLWKEPERELQYFVLDTLQQMEKQLPAPFYETMEQLVIQKSWWDTVDYLASIIGKHFQRHPHLIQPVSTTWINSDNIWLQRVALLFRDFSF